MKRGTDQVCAVYGDRMVTLRALVISAVIGASRLGSAQPSAPPPPAPAPKSPALALALSIGLPAVAVATVWLSDGPEFRARGTAKTAWHAVWWTSAGAFLAGPTLGSIYAGNPWNLGLQLRLAGAGICIAAVMEQPDGGNGPTGWDLVFLGGLAVYGSGMIAETATAQLAIARRNRRHREAQISVVPIATSRDTVPGIGVSGSF